jgi:NADH:ubiquinone oxidoreductase subunit 3 (subunit A)
MVSSPYFSLGVLFLVALCFGLTPLALAWLWAKAFSPAKPNAIKNAIYECGLVSKLSSCFRSPLHSLDLARRPAWRCWFLCCC